MEAWVLFTLLAVVMQSVRTAGQKKITEKISIQAATLVRFLFGIKFAAIYFAYIYWFYEPIMFEVKTKFFLFGGLASVAQVLATVCLINVLSMKNFAVGTSLAKTEAILTAILGALFFSSTLSFLGYISVFIGSGGLIFASRWGVNLFLYLSVEASSIISPLVIGAQLSIPLAIILSSIFIGETINYKKWILIITSFLGIVFIGFDPKIADEILGFLLICCMAFFYASSQVFSRYLKELDVKFTSASMGFIAFIILINASIFFEGNTISYLKNLNLEAWLMVLHAGILCSLFGHMSMFYLYKFYPVGQVLPFYALFPVFGMLLSFFIFGEIPTLIMVIGGIIVISSVFLLQKVR